MKYRDMYSEAAKHSDELERHFEEAPEHLPGIYCNVSDCLYHDGEQFCCADKINVGPNFAKSSSDTACTTFKSRRRG